MEGMRVFEARLPARPKRLVTLRNRIKYRAVQDADSMTMREVPCVGQRVIEVYADKLGARFSRQEFGGQLFLLLTLSADDCCGVSELLEGLQKYTIQVAEESAFFP
jgi:hypothetical protein